ncbi:MAG: hypothetical protein MI924_23935 [Chloroflexales bacterium]|nr:hypothetical protein [Chloroflexales bacterium]
MQKKPSLSAALHKASGKEPPGVVVEAAPPTPSDGQAQSSRQGKRLIGGHFDPVVAKELKRLALDHGVTVQTLLAEALNDLFVKYGKPPLA